MTESETEVTEEPVAATNDPTIDAPEVTPLEAPGEPTGEPDPPTAPQEAPGEQPPVDLPPSEPPGSPAWPPSEPPGEPGEPPPEPPGEPQPTPMEAPGAPGQPPAIEASAAAVADAPTEAGPGAEAPAEAPAAQGPRTVGRLVADALRSAGVRYAFTVPGESFLGLLDALGDAGIRVVATRHEGGAAFMAEAHGQLTGRPAVCLGTRGVGAANLAIGIHTARQDSTPMFAIIGQVENAHRGHEAFQEIDQVATIGGLAKWAAEPSQPADVAPAMSEAIRQALGGRPGPVLLSFAEDLLDQPAPDDARVDAGRPGQTRPTDEDLRAVIELLASAERPVILAGGGILRARTSTELLRFAELLQVPVIAAWRRADVISNEHPLYLGMAGFGAAASVRERLAAADAMLVIGCRLNEPTSYDDSIPSADDALGARRPRACANRRPAACRP